MSDEARALTKREAMVVARRAMVVAQKAHAAARLAEQLAMVAAQKASDAYDNALHARRDELQRNMKLTGALADTGSADWRKFEFVARLEADEVISVADAEAAK